MIGRTKSIRTKSVACCGAALAVVAMVSACGLFGGSEPQPPGAVAPGPAPAQREDVLGPVSPDSRIYSDNSGGFPDSVRIVVVDEETWTSTWDRATSFQGNPVPKPSINFAEDMVIVVAAGRMTPEDQIRVDSVGVRSVRSENGDLVEVFEVVVRTIVGCGRLRVDAFPLEIVRTARFEGEVRFVDRRDQNPSCGGSA